MERLEQATLQRQSKPVVARGSGEAGKYLKNDCGDGYTTLLVYNTTLN